MHGESIELAREAHGEVGDINHLLHFALSLRREFSRFECDERAEIVLVIAEFFADGADDAGRVAERGTFSNVQKYRAKTEALLRIAWRRPCGHALIRIRRWG